MDNPEDSKLKSILTRDIMSEEVSVITPQTKIGQVAHLMLRERVSGYPVVDEQKQVVGIVTLTDLFHVIDRMNNEKGSMSMEVVAGFKNQCVEKIMSKDIICIDPDSRLDTVLEIMIKWGIHTFPVVKDKTIVGIVGRHDILNAVFAYG